MDVDTIVSFVIQSRQVSVGRAISVLCHVNWHHSLKVILKFYDSKKRMLYSTYLILTGLLYLVFIVCFQTVM